MYGILTLPLTTLCIVCLILIAVLILFIIYNHIGTKQDHAVTCLVLEYYEFILKSKDTVSPKTFIQEKEAEVVLGVLSKTVFEKFLYRIYTEYKPLYKK